RHRKESGQAPRRFKLLRESRAVRGRLATRGRVGDSPRETSTAPPGASHRRATRPPPTARTSTTTACASFDDTAKSAATARDWPGPPGTALRRELRQRTESFRRAP